MMCLDTMLQPGEHVVWRNRPGMGLGTTLLVAAAVIGSLLGLLAWLGGGWDSLWQEPYRLMPLAALAVIGGYRPADAVLVTDRRLLLTRGLLRRTVVEVARADIGFARVTASIPYYGQVVTVVCRDAASIHVHRADAAGTAAYDRAEVETIQSKDAQAMCDALTDPARPWARGEPA